MPAGKGGAVGGPPAPGTQGAGNAATQRGAARARPADPFAAIRSLPLSRRAAALHEIRNDLAVITGYTSLLTAQLERYGQLPLAWLAERLRRIQRAAADITALLAELEER